MKPETFIRNVLRKKLNMKEILVGDGFTFGWHGSGNVRLLKKLSKKNGFKVRKIGLLKKGKRIISSTYIRALIINGKLKEAGRLLGRPVSILGTVTRGTRRGRILGYPTANIDPHHEAIPASGVYAVYVKLDNKRYRAVLNMGFRPTFGPMRYTLSAIRSALHQPGYLPEPTIEVHILNFNRNIYKREMEIIFVKRLRAERRFKNRKRLIKRIMLDEKVAKRILI